MPSSKKFFAAVLLFITGLSFFLQCEFQFQDTLKLFLIHVDLGNFWISPIRNKCNDDTIFTETDYQKLKNDLPARLRDIPTSPNLCPTTSPYLKVPYAANISVFTGHLHAPQNCTARQRVAIIVPYRNRPTQLESLLDHLNPILERQQLEFQVFIVNQLEDGTFNRAKLMNAGVKYLKEQSEIEWDCYIFHDVDLLLEDYGGLYRCSNDHPRHLSAAINKYRYKTPWKGITGGVMAFTPEQFDKVNGYSNEYWGWGCEDDDMYIRVVSACLRLEQADYKYYPYDMLIHGYENEYKIGTTFRYTMVTHAHERLSTDGLSSIDAILTKSSENEKLTVIDAKIGKPPADIEENFRQTYNLPRNKTCRISPVPFFFLWGSMLTAFLAVLGLYRHFQSNWMYGYKRIVDVETMSLTSNSSFQHME